ncbi:hypothetical protein PLESTM_001885400 [Pleodorina starrii]|nr:hypothetical protein PLESTM_001885400 [Pleodorina starrii]
MELDAQVDSQQLDGVGPSPASQPANGKDGAKDPERFYCPYPGCNRSFAELWRLKVHFRAPPDIRGSGKERGHGTELTHCPKCGKTLKPGKHHVGCSGSKASARQNNKRSRAAGEAEPPDEALTASQISKQVKGDFELEPVAASWSDFTRSSGPHALHSLTLQPPLKQEQQDWPTAIQSGILYGPNGTATACWLPGQVNGFVPQLPAQGYVQPQFSSELQFAGGAHGFSQQVTSFPSLPAYPQPGAGLAEPGQVLSVPPNGNMQQLAGVPAMPTVGGLPGMGQVLFHQQPHATSWVQSAAMDQHGQQATASMTQMASALAHGQPQQHQQQPPPPNDSTCNGGQRAAPPPSGQGSDAGGSDGAGAAAITSGAPGALPSPPFQPPQQQPAKPTASNDSLGSAFGDVEEFTREFGRIPSPPPLPVDFHSSSSGGGGSMLFNFAQFGQKLPRSQSQTRLDKSLSAVGLGLDNGLEADLLYDHSDDGDLMQLLFGVPDELPTMATIHLHKWSNEDEGEAHAGDSGAARTGSGTGPGLELGPGPSDVLAVQAEPLDRSSSHTVAGATPSLPQAPGGSAPALEGNNGKTELLLDGPEAHSHGSGPQQYLVHGGGKGALAQLVNGLNGQHHAGDDHHK